MLGAGRCRQRAGVGGVVRPKQKTALRRSAAVARFQNRVGGLRKPSVVGTDPPTPARAPPAAVVITAPVDAAPPATTATATEHSTAAAATATSAAAPTAASASAATSTTPLRNCWRGAGGHHADRAETIDGDQCSRCQKACEDPVTASTCDRCLHVCFLHVPGALYHSRLASAPKSQVIDNSRHCYINLT
jgi:hypothetical protein